jgi:hypothetical protein
VVCRYQYSQVREDGGRGGLSCSRERPGVKALKHQAVLMFVRHEALLPLLRPSSQEASGMLA